MGLSALQYSCLENLHRQRSLVGYSLWDHKKSDTTEQLGIAHSVYQHEGPLGIPDQLVEFFSTQSHGCLLWNKSSWI